MDITVKNPIVGIKFVRTSLTNEVEAEAILVMGVMKSAKLIFFISS
jgi:hypothetical protein